MRLLVSRQEPPEPHEAHPKHQHEQRDDCATEIVETLCGYRFDEQRNNKRATNDDYAAEPNAHEDRDGVAESRLTAQTRLAKSVGH
jgi:hypothetical protein